MTVTKTGVDVTTIPRIDHDEAMRIAAAENARFADLIRELRAEDWTKPTDCALWDVHDVVAHVVGATEGQASFPEFVRQVWRGRPITKEIGGAHWWDGMNQLQVREREGRTPTEMLTEFTTVAPKAVRARTRLPRPVARLPLLQLPPPVGRQPVAYLFDVGFTRDTWMHRVDIAQATGLPMTLDAAHDGRIVADLVAEWAGNHGEAFRLELTGPAGGVFRAGPVDDPGVESHALDAIEFTRILAERAEGDGVLRHKQPL
jgi:uncharacterized protein (TIGR03083 family)